MLKRLLLLLCSLFGLSTCSDSQTTPFASGPFGDPPAGNHPQYILSVRRGSIPLGQMTLEIFTSVAPKHAANFDSLVNIGFYDETAFHRVIPGFVIQGGDPNSKDKPRETWGIGDLSQRTVPAEFNNIAHKRGIISAARKADDVNSATSQFFICVADTPNLNGQYTVYGRVISGMEIADIIVNEPRDARDNPLTKISMTIRKKQ